MRGWVLSPESWWSPSPRVPGVLRKDYVQARVCQGSFKPTPPPPTSPAWPDTHQHGPKLHAAGELQTAPKSQGFLQVLLTGLGDPCRDRKSTPCPR